jgi:hypothetical protein
MDDGSLVSHCSPKLTRGARRVKYGSAQRLIEFQRVEDADDEVVRPPARPFVLIGHAASLTPY